MWTFRLVVVAGLLMAGCGNNTPVADGVPSAHGVPSGATETAVPSTSAPTADDPGSARLVGEPPATDVVATPVAADSPSDGRTRSEPASVALTTYTTSEGLPGERVVQVDIGLDGTVWVAVEIGPVHPGSEDLRHQVFARFDGERWVDVGTPDLVALDGAEASPHAFGMDMSGGPHGTLWVVNTGFDSTGDAYRYDGARWTSPYRTEEWFATGEAAIDGSLWTIGLGPRLDTPDNLGLYRLDGDTLTRQPDPPAGIPCVFCVQYDVDRDGGLWMRGNGWITQFDGRTWTVLDEVHPSLDGSGNAIGEGRWTLGVDGSHWLVHATGLDEARWVVTRLGDDGVAQMPISGDDAIVEHACIAEHRSYLGDVTEEVIDEHRADLGHLVAGFAGDAAGRLWLAVDCVGVFGLDPDGARTIEIGLDDGLPTLLFHDVAAEPDGSVWVATDTGLVRIVTG